MRNLIVTITVADADTGQILGETKSETRWPGMSLEMVADQAARDARDLVLKGQTPASGQR